VNRNLSFGPDSIQTFQSSGLLNPSSSNRPLGSIGLSNQMSSFSNTNHTPFPMPNINNGTSMGFPIGGNNSFNSSLNSFTKGNTFPNPISNPSFTTGNTLSSPFLSNTNTNVTLNNNNVFPSLNTTVKGFGNPPPFTTNSSTNSFMPQNMRTNIPNNPGPFSNNTFTNTTPISPPNNSFNNPPAFNSFVPPQSQTTFRSPFQTNNNNGLTNNTDTRYNNPLMTGNGGSGVVSNPFLAVNTSGTSNNTSQGGGMGLLDNREPPGRNSYKPTTRR
jgi:hypothetical protein